MRAPAATTFYVTISGLGGEPDYDQRFKMWANDIDSSLKKAGGDTNVVTLDGAHARGDPRALRGNRQRQAKPADALVVMLIGHGTYDGVDYKFNIPGPDITGAELAALLDRVPATRQLVVNMTSSSGGSIEFLRRPNRVVIAATKTGTEKNATVFARYWAEALRDPAADADKNESISALEAFHYAAAQDRRILRQPKAPGHRARRAGRHRQGRGRARSLGRRTAKAGWPPPFPWCGWAPTPLPRAIPPSGRCSTRRSSWNRPSTS